MCILHATYAFTVINISDPLSQNEISLLNLPRLSFDNDIYDQDKSGLIKMLILWVFLL